MELQKAIAMRRSTRSFKPDQISEKDLETILHAGFAAPVGMKRYDSVHFTVVQNQEYFDRLSAAAAKQTGNPDMKPLYGAPTMVAVSVSSDIFSSGVDTADAGCIIENMLLTATELGLGSVYLFGAVKALVGDTELVQALKLPEGFMPVSAVALGYPTEPISGENEKKTIAVNRI